MRLSAVDQERASDDQVFLADTLDDALRDALTQLVIKDPSDPFDFLVDSFNPTSTKLTTTSTPWPDLSRSAFTDTTSSVITF